MDYLFRRMALEYLSHDERAELGIFSIAERIQPTLPGVDESTMHDVAGNRDPVRPQVGAVGRRAGESDGARPRAGDARGQHAGTRHRASLRRPDVHAMRCPDDPRRKLPRLPELRHHQRLQLTHAGPRGSPGRTDGVPIGSLVGDIPRPRPAWCGAVSLRTAPSACR